MTTASIIIIGDEILGNKFPDENTPFLLAKCDKLNLKVLSVQVIPDTLERIASTVYEESKRSQYVFTTGGVGPTHDDMTFEGVAKAFGEELYRHPELVYLLEQYSKLPNESAYRMTEVPTSAELIDTSRGFPQVKVHNVFIFPGVPGLLKRKFESIEHLLFGQKLHKHRIYLNAQETVIASKLSIIQSNHPLVNIGSYPRFHETPSLIITLESEFVQKLESVQVLIETEFSQYLHNLP